jgi:alpha-beta hydrolase superfamily lysophospholipase
MRPLELVLILILAVYFGWPLLPYRRPRWLEILPTISLLILVVHLLFEGYRWQMFPIYLLVGVALLIAAFRLARGDNLKTTPRKTQVIGALVGIGAVVLAAALPGLFPVPDLPEPGGLFSVGTLSLMLQDDSRVEIYGENVGQSRELMVQLWYPALAEPGADTSPWIEKADVVGRAVADWLGFPSFALDHLRYARTNSYVDSPLTEADDPFPVILFSHGWGGFRAQNTYQMEELASQGYVVAALDHTYGSASTVFPDGQVAKFDPQTLPQDVSEQEFQEAAYRLVNQWAGDLGYVLDTLEQLNDDDPDGRFTGRLALDAVGVMGHSTGGGAAIEFCAQDARCKAVLGMDAYLTPVSQEVLENGFSQPGLFMFSELWPSAENNRRFTQLFGHLQGPAQSLIIMGTDHYDFSDLPLLSPLAPQMGLKGPLNGQRVVAIIKAYSIAFFDQYLRNADRSLLQTAIEAYPEVQVQSVK